MTWTANVTEVTTNETNVVATVQFVNSASNEAITRQVPGNDLSPDSLAAYCKRVIDQLDARDVAVESIAVGAVTLPAPGSIKAVDVDAASVKGFLLLQQAYFTLKSFSAAAATGDATHDAALMSAKSLIAILDLPNAPAFRMSDPATNASVKGMADALLGQETASPGTTGITQAIHDGLLALAQVPV